MPIIHIVATVVSAVVFLHTVLKQRQPGTLTWRELLLAALAAVVAILAVQWLLDSHPEASELFRSGVRIQLASGVGIVAVSVVRWMQGRRLHTSSTSRSEQ